MYSNMKIVILILLLFTGGSVIKAQRHYKRISALEGSYGTNIFGKADNMANISFSKYIDRTSYWKAGLNYFEKSFDYSVNTEATQPLGIMPVMQNQQREETARNWFVNGSYNRTIASNLKSIYWNIGIHQTSIKRVSIYRWSGNRDRNRTFHIAKARIHRRNKRNVESVVCKELEHRMECGIEDSPL